MTDEQRLIDDLRLLVSDYADQLEALMGADMSYWELASPHETVEDVVQPLSWRRENNALHQRARSLGVALEAWVDGRG